MTIRAMYPRLVVSDAARAIEFYAEAFGAKEVERYTDPSGKIVHAEVRIGELRLTLKDEDDGDPSPTTLGGSAVLLSLEVDDADALGAAMLAAGATVVYPIADQPYGSRGGRLADPFGHLWMVDQKIEDLTQDQIQTRLLT
jgi:uncharacterized glyoxalase superfamily protein PhnB